MAMRAGSRRLGANSWVQTIVRQMKVPEKAYEACKLVESHAIGTFRNEKERMAQLSRHLLPCSKGPGSRFVAISTVGMVEEHLYLYYHLTEGTLSHARALLLREWHGRPEDDGREGLYRKAALKGFWHLSLSITVQ